MEKKVIRNPKKNKSGVRSLTVFDDGGLFAWNIHKEMPNAYRYKKRYVLPSAFVRRKLFWKVCNLSTSTKIENFDSNF